MDIAKIFDTLNQGIIVSLNSDAHKDLARFLTVDTNFDEVYNALRKIGYVLIGENGYFYLSKKNEMTNTDIGIFLQKHKELIMAIAILRTLFQRLDKGSTISFLELASEYESYKKTDSSIKQKLLWLYSGKGNDDEKQMLEYLIKILEKNNVIEKISVSNNNDYKVLNAIDYYISIVDIAEK